MCGFNRRERSSRKRCLLTIWFQWWLARKKICDISGDPQVSQMTWLRLFYKCTASWFVCCLPWFWHSTDFCRSLGSSIICLEFVKDLENFRTRTCKCWLRFIFGPGVLICPTLQMQVLWCRQLVILGDVFVKNDDYEHQKARKPRTQPRERRKKHRIFCFIPYTLEVPYEASVDFGSWNTLTGLGLCAITTITMGVILLDFNVARHTIIIQIVSLPLGWVV